MLSGLKKKSTNVAACVFVSPNFGLARPIQNLLLQLPKVRIWGPFVMGRSRGFEPRSLVHEKYWTQSYGIEAVYTMMEAVQAAARLRIKAFTTPLALIYCSEDKVVSPKKILSFFDNETWNNSIIKLHDPINIGNAKSSFYNRLAYDEILASLLVNSEIRRKIKKIKKK